MALKPKIQALIDFANETTEAGDVTLGDAVKTLADGYNGGANVPSSPLVIPSGEMSSKLAALLAYSNEVTGAGDTRMGDAIKTLCEGYGSGSDLVFFDTLISDGAAYINTFFQPLVGDDVRLVAKPLLVDSPILSSGAAGTYQLIILGKYLKYFTTGTASEMALDTNFYFEWHFFSSGLIRMTNQSTGNYAEVTREISKTKGETYDVLYLAKRSGQNKFAKTSYRSLTIERDGQIMLKLRPCTFNGEPGMWDEVSRSFFGNANSTGAFSVAND